MIKATHDKNKIIYYCNVQHILHSYTFALSYMTFLILVFIIFMNNQRLNIYIYKYILVQSLICLLVLHCVMEIIELL